MLSYSLTNFEIQKYYQNKHKFIVVYSRNNLPKTEDETYVINLYEYKSTGTQWIAFYLNGANVTKFQSFGVEYIPKEIKKFIGNKIIITYIYRMQAYNSKMCGYLCIGFIDFMLKDNKSFLDYTNLFSPNEYEKNNKIMLKCSQLLETKNLFYE